VGVSKDLYRRIRRLKRRGPLTWTVRRRPGRDFCESQIYEGKRDVSHLCPALQSPRIQRSLQTGKPVLIRLFRANRKGEAFAEKPPGRHQFEIARRREWILFRLG
jgi:hypothetical protein